MARKRALNCVGLLFACMVLATLCTVVSVWPKTRTRPVDMHDLMVDVSVFPQGWYVFFGPVTIPERARRGERESLYVVFYPEGFESGIDGAHHEVYRYRNETDAAIAFYSDFLGNEFPNLRDAMITPWAVPEEWSYESSTADRFKFACAELDILRRFRDCTAVAQYEEYISVFSTDVSPEYMTLEDLGGILKAIDERMALYLAEDGE